MFCRKILILSEITGNCNPQLYCKRVSLRPVQSQLRNGFHNRRSQARKGQLQPEHFENLRVDSGPILAKNLVKPFLFTVGFSTATLAGCAIWQYESLRAHAARFLRKQVNWFNDHQNKTKTELGVLQKWWSGLRESEKIFYPILAANVLVFGAWRVRSWQPFMVKYFCSNPAGSAVCVPMLLSTFSHYATLHLAANMYVLYSFMPAAVASMGKEQFLAMYLSGGVISSFASFLYKAAVSQPGLSLGASGAIMAVLAYVCVQYPDTQLSIIFLPMYTFAAGTAIKVIMGLDLAGVIMTWKFFDHAAHLGGALFGIAWCYWGAHHIWGNREKFLQYYHTIRETGSNR